jgi:Fic family protein
MLFELPELQERESDVLSQIDELKAALKLQLHEPRRWQGSLRRLSIARNLQGSNSIEGFDAALDDAAAVAMGEEPVDTSTATKLALEGYRRAMTYVLQLAQEPPIEFSRQLLLSLHFMMTDYDLANRPGRWRSGAIYVHDEDSGQLVYEGADVGDVDRLMDELVAGLQAHRADSPILSGAMAHLNLVMIHPFRDGNGRMARCLQSLVLAANGTLAPVFMSIEEYLGRNTRAYYDVLGVVGQGSWQPHRDARPWLRFILTAHLRQARTLRRRVKESERTWLELERVVRSSGLPERLLPTLFDAAVGLRVRNSTHRGLVALEEEITDQTAGRDLKLAVDAGLLIARGEKRGRHYVRGGALSDLRVQVMQQRDPAEMADPFKADD